MAPWPLPGAISEHRVWVSLGASQKQKQPFP